jgi:hypothetical protein
MWSHETCYVAFFEALTRCGRKHAPTLAKRTYKQRNTFKSCRPPPFAKLVAPER